MDDDASLRVGLAPPTVLCNCQVLRQAARQTTAFYDVAMAPFGLRISQFAVLNRLRKAGASNLQILAADLVLDRTTLARNLRPLERDGFIASEADPGDRRVRRLVLTDKGRACVAAALPAWRTAQMRFEARYGADEAAGLRAALARLTEALGAAEA